MSNSKNVGLFIEELHNLNTQLVKIENMLTVQTQSFIHSSHKECLQSCLKYDHHLSVLKHKAERKNFFQKCKVRLLQYFYSLKKIKKSKFVSFL